MLCEQVLHLLRLQRGLIASRQLCVAEPDKYRRRRMYERAEFEWATPRVLRHRATAWSVEQELMLGVLDAGRGARLWGKSAASHWGFSRFRRLPAHVGVPRGARTASRLPQIHVLRLLADGDLVTHDDIPIARPECVVLWLAGMWTHRFGHEVAKVRVDRALDQAWRQGLIDGPFIHHLAERSGGRGRSGIVVLRESLAERPIDYQPAGSGLEERFEEIVPLAVRALLRRQVTVDWEPVVRTVDFELTSWPLIVEINGEAFHTSLTDRAADAERYERLLDLGYSVAVFWEYDIWHDAESVNAAMRHLARTPDRIPSLHRPTKAPWQW